MTKIPLAKKSLGQHWLHDASSLQAMCSAAAVASSDTVLEIGPGTGTLTERLLDTGATVTAVELDRDRAAEVLAMFRGRALRVYVGSIMEFDLTGLPADYKVVANIPYYLTSNLIRLLSESPNPPQCAVLLVQKEVAQRVTALPGQMSLLSVTAQYFWQASLGLEVPARLFIPPPKVDSQILVLNRRQSPLFSQIDQKLFFWLVKAGFSARRKTLENSLAGGARLSKLEAQAIITQAQLPARVRPQELTLQQWYAVYQAYAASKT